MEAKVSLLHTESLVKYLPIPFWQLHQVEKNKVLRRPAGLFGCFLQHLVTLDGVSIQIHQGEIVALLGRNGAGKSTLFDIISGMTSPTKGSVCFWNDEGNGKWDNITREPLYKRARRGICYLPQKQTIFSNLSVRDNLLGIMELFATEDLQRMIGPSFKTREAYCDKLLVDFELSDSSYKSAHVLSGGERRRLEIARTFILRPRLILLDEPFAALDHPSIQICARLIRRVRDEGVSVLLVDHNTEDIMRISDRVYVMENGKLVLEGAAWEVVRNPKVAHVFEGKVEDYLQKFPCPTLESQADPKDREAYQVGISPVSVESPKAELDLGSTLGRTSVRMEPDD